MHRLLCLLALFLPLGAFAQTNAVVCFLGDSTSARLPWVNGGIGWPQRLQLNRQQQRFAIVNNAIGGRRCDQLEVEAFPSFIAGGKSRGCTRLVIQCGINDILQNWTTDQIYGVAGTPGAPGTPGSSTTPGPLLRMVNAITAVGIPVTVVTVSPLGGSYNYPAGVQTQHMDVNTRIRTEASVTTPALVTVVDLYRATGQTGAIATALATDPGSGVTMPAPFNFGDGIHFTSGNGSVIDATTGDGRVAEAFNATTGALP